MTSVRRRVAMVAGTMLLAGAASSGVAMASTPTVAPTMTHPSVQTNHHHDCDDDWGWWDDCDHGGYDHDHGGYDHDHGGYDHDHGGYDHDHGGYDHDHGGYDHGEY